MPLNLHGGGGGDFVPFIKYNAKSGRWYVKEENNPDETEIVNPQLAFDFANIRTGWIWYAAGSAPQKVYDPSLTEAAPQPVTAGNWKRGFEVVVHGRPPIGVREFSSTAGSVIEAINLAYMLFERDRAAHPNQMPIFRCTRVKPITSKQGTNYAPVFEFVGWGGAPSNGHAAPPPQAPSAPASAGLTTAQAWQAYKASRAPGNSEADMKAWYIADCKAYFGDTFDHRTVRPEKWRQFVDDGFALGELAAPGTAVPEDSIPF